MARIFDCSVNAELLTGMRLARRAIGRGDLAVIPTDTVYGVAADAFSPSAVNRLRVAKGRGRSAPPPVLIPNMATLDALAFSVPDVIRTLVNELWPGGLTVVLPATSSLVWDLGDTGGTVALRMPAHPIALEFLAETGPLAVSSANKTGLPAARTASAAESMLGDEVAVYLDAGEVGGSPDNGLTGDGSEGERAVGDGSSTIIDATPLVEGNRYVFVLREGVVSIETIAHVMGDRVEIHRREER